MVDSTKHNKRKGLYQVRERLLRNELDGPNVFLDFGYKGKTKLY